MSKILGGMAPPKILDTPSFGFGFDFDFDFDFDWDWDRSAGHETINERLVST